MAEVGGTRIIGSFRSGAPTASPAFTGTATFVNQSTSGNATFNSVLIQPTVDAATGVFTIKNAAGTSTIAAVSTLSGGNALTLSGIGGGNALMADIVTVSSFLYFQNLRINGFGTNLIISAVPTISSGFGVNSSVTSENGSATLRVNVGTGGAATTGVISMPAAASGWNCYVNNLTAAAANRADNTRHQSSTTNTITLQNQTTSTGAAVAWQSNDILELICMAY